MKLGFLYTFIFLYNTVVAQDSLIDRSPQSAFPDSAYTVERILVVGNVHTQNFVILREMSLKPGFPITQEAIEYDKSRIYSLGLFNRVSMFIRPTTPMKADLLIEVHERWYIFPYPIFGIKDRDWGKVYYGIGLLHNNFRGRNEKLSFSLVFGYDPSVALSYRNPFLDEEGGSFLETQVSYSKVHNRSQQFVGVQNDFDERHFSVNLTLGKRFGVAHTAWISAGYEIVDIPGQVPVRTLSPSGTDKYPIITVGYTYDTRDLIGYPTNGMLFRTAVTKFGRPSDHINIIRYGSDARGYLPLFSSLVLTGRMFTDIAAAGPLPAYKHVYFGYGERIRGHFNEIMEGENIFGFSSELHFPLFPTRYFVVSFLPSAFSVWKFGVVATLFADAGTTWYRGEPLAINRFAKGYGTGLNILLLYDATFRIEYALNETRRGQLIFTAGASF